MCGILYVCTIYIWHNDDTQDASVLLGRFLLYRRVYKIIINIFMPRGQKTKTQYSATPTVNYVPFIARGTL